MRVMKAGERLFMVRVDRGEEVVVALLTFATEHAVRSAAVTGLGAVERARLAYFDASAKEYLTRDFPEVTELVSLTGNLGLFEGRPFLHAHVVLSDREYHCRGGHLVSAIVAVTGEFAIQVGVAPLLRQANPELGIKEQDLP